MSEEGLERGEALDRILGLDVGNSSWYAQLMHRLLPSLRHKAAAQLAGCPKACLLIGHLVASIIIAAGPHAQQMTSWHLVLQTLCRMTSNLAVSLFCFPWRS